MNLVRLTAGVLALALPWMAHGAAADGPSPPASEFERCLASGDAAKGVTVAMATCINLERAREDKRLNTAYAGVMGVRSEAAREALRNEQRAWIKRRDHDCEQNLTGGTIDMLERASCHLEMTTVRAAELEQMIGQGGAATSEARLFPYDEGVVDLLVIGSAAQSLYERMPGRGAKNACGGEGVHKAAESLICTKAGADYSCHIWLDASKAKLAPPETDDC